MYLLKLQLQSSVDLAGILVSCSTLLTLTIGVILLLFEVCDLLVLVSQTEVAGCPRFVEFVVFFLLFLEQTLGGRRNVTRL